jgi:UPF0042 nucleotide-binding protein
MTTRAKSAAADPASEPAGSAVTALRPRQVLLVTGLSGAGHTTALKVLEDLGYEAVDNLPLFLLGGLTGDVGGAEIRPMAIGVDSRTRDFTATALIEHRDRLQADPGLAVRLLYLDCGEESLRRRFTETRRRHPLALDRPVDDGIRRERQLLGPLREAADLVIDTTDLAIGDLRRLLRGHFGLDHRPAAAITIVSFSYRNGLPREADLVFDVRFLRNPHYDPTLRPLTGRDAEVGQFIATDPAFAPFFASLTQLLLPLLPSFEREGKSYLTIAVGCTGGRHRSVFVAERLGAWLAAQDRPAIVRHRDTAGLSSEES